jgi:transposase
MRGRSFSSEYKRDAIALVLSSGRHIRQTAHDLGISVNTLKGWVKQHDRDAESGPLPVGLSAEEECRLLRKRVASLEEDNEILKKFQAFLSSQPKNDTAS